ncbi:hypothetical protein GSI_09672 [Ganoderma sinense ZZ0214-1]|uniref:Uncharacterized protein n=1 Tax=Ganoderma sinense ZZ0214-1 TaxID=1077348 RepID=A0A2G8S3B1_9APHY|nr:hypothetical protein GSI_09672 [Ganoderma sinense ZZ0214-1]
MFSSIGFDARGASRFFPSAPRGFSVHVFKNSSLSSQPPPAPMAPVAHPPKFDTSTTQSRTSNSAAQWSRQQSYRPPQHDPSERKQLPLAAPAVPPSQDRRLVQVPATNPMNQAWPVDTKLSKSQKSYGIYPSLTSDIYIYERSITSASYDDELASSPSSDSSSSDSDHFPHTATFASLEISSTRASSSTETLESTLTVPAPGTHRNVVASAPPPLAIAAPPRSSPTRPQHDTTSTARLVIPITRTHSQLQRSISTARVIPPISLASTPLDNLSDSSDSDTAVSDTHPDMVVDMAGAHWSGPPTYYPGHPSSSFRTRRDSVDRAAASAYRREAPPPPAVSKNPSMPRPTVPPPPSQRSAHRDDSPRIDDAQPRAPPGLSGGVATPPDGSPPRGAQDPSSSSPTSRSVGGGAPALARTTSTRGGPVNSFPGPQPIARTLNAESLPPSIPSFPPAPAPAAAISASPPRRDPRTPSPQNASQTGGAAAGAMQAPSPTQGSPTSAAPKRNVRWNDNLVCPSPILPEHRRKGWFNRRGDQLWTNDGQYKVPAPGQEFPLDLASYPEPNTGWMNEEGVRIDMQHRLIPKAPLRSALKRHTS